MSYGDHISFVIVRNLYSFEIYMKDEGKIDFTYIRKRAYLIRSIAFVPVLRDRKVF